MLTTLRVCVVNGSFPHIVQHGGCAWVPATRRGGQARQLHEELLCPGEATFLCAHSAPMQLRRVRQDLHAHAPLPCVFLLRRGASLSSYCMGMEQVSRSPTRCMHPASLRTLPLTIVLHWCVRYRSTQGGSEDLSQVPPFGDQVSASGGGGWR